MQIQLTGNATILKSIEMDDAEFVANLRSIPTVYEFLSNTGEITLKQQEEWLLNFLQNCEDFYFIIIDKNTRKKTGTISLYNFNAITKDTEFGRYICTNNINAIESELMILQFAFNVMKLDKVYCKTADENSKV
jgi:RimJ/RimL family protein N-acetyltransferase